MQRTKEDFEEIKWRKIGGGSFRIRSGKIIKPNQVFTAKEEDIPEAFRDVVIPVNEKQLKTAKEKELPVSPDLAGPKYEVIHRGGGWYDVVNEATGQVMNASKVRKDKAQELKDSLENE